MAVVTEQEWNPRYVAYSDAHGFDPDTMLAVDKFLWPGGCMSEFMLWIQERWREWGELAGVPDRHRLLHQAEFDAWLNNRKGAGDA